MKNRLSEYIVISEVAGRNRICCRKCDYMICEETENWKSYAFFKETSLAKAGTLFQKSKRFVFREFYCPGCGTMFDIEVCLKNAPFVWDSQIKV